MSWLGWIAPVAKFAGAYQWWLIGGGAVIALGTVGYYKLDNMSLERDIAKLQTEYADAARQKEADNRAKERQWTSEQDAIKQELAKTRERAAIDAERADAADARAGRLSVRIDDVVAQGRRRCSNPTVASVGAAASDPIGMLADVLRRADARAGLLAREADKRGAAGLECERLYEAVAPKPLKPD